MGEEFVWQVYVNANNSVLVLAGLTANISTAVGNIVYL